MLKWQSVPIVCYPSTEAKLEAKRFVILLHCWHLIPYHDCSLIVVRWSTFGLLEVPSADFQLLSSAFHLSYNMLLNQIRCEEGNPENLLRNSFYQFQADHAIPDLEVSI